MDLRPQMTEAMERLKGVFLEMPGSQLTVNDACRLSGLNRALCEDVLLALEDARFLKRGRADVYLRRTSDSPL